VFCFTKEIEYTYDVFNRRIAKSIDWDGAGEDDPVGVEYIYSGWDILLAFNGESSLTNRYLHGPGEDNILADEQFAPSTPAEMPSAPGDLFWMLADNLGSVRDIVDSDGNVENHLTYDGFGNVTSETNPNLDSLPGFQGLERDQESGLNHANLRDGDPRTGGWLQPDKIGFLAGDTNLYRIVGNGPTNGTDPSGLEPPQDNFLKAINDALPPGYTPITPEMKALIDKYYGKDYKGPISMDKIQELIKLEQDLAKLEAEKATEAAQKQYQKWLADLRLPRTNLSGAQFRLRYLRILMAELLEVGRQIQYHLYGEGKSMLPNGYPPFTFADCSLVGGTKPKDFQTVVTIDEWFQLAEVIEYFRSTYLTLGAWRVDNEPWFGSGTHNYPGISGLTILDEDFYAEDSVALEKLLHESMHDLGWNSWGTGLGRVSSRG
jgi:RHS repeat-associated protein